MMPWNRAPLRGIVNAATDPKPDRGAGVKTRWLCTALGMAIGVPVACDRQVFLGDNGPKPIGSSDEPDHGPSSPSRSKDGGTGNLNTDIVDSGSCTDLSQSVQSFGNSGDAALSCEYHIPDSLRPYLEVIQIVTTIGLTGTPQPLTRVRGESSCHPENGGWYYDNSNNPQGILFCNASCESLLTNQESHFEVFYGCASTPSPL